MSKTAGIFSQATKSTPGKDVDDFLSIFHALTISCESAMARTGSGDFSSMISELGGNIETLLPKELFRGAARKRSVEQCALLLTDFLMSSNRFGAIELSADGDDVYCLSISKCGFAKNGLHRRLRPSGIICPMALLFASFLVRAMRDMRIVSLRPSVFEPFSSLTKMCISKSEREGRSSPFRDSSATAGSHVLDKMDFEILRIIQGNARLSNVEIANALNTSEATVRRRIQAMLDGGIIKCFTAKINQSRLSRKVRVQLALEVRPDNMDAVASHLLARPELCSLYRSLGEYNLICEFLMGDMSSVQDLVDEISRTEGVLRTNSMIATSPLKPCPWFD